MSGCTLWAKVTEIQLDVSLLSLLSALSSLPLVRWWGPSPITFAVQPCLGWPFQRQYLVMTDRKGRFWWDGFAPLWFIVTILCLLLFFFPYYSSFFILKKMCEVWSKFSGQQLQHQIIKLTYKLSEARASRRQRNGAHNLNGRHLEGSGLHRWWTTSGNSQSR